MSEFNLVVKSLTPPSLPPYDGIPVSLIKSSPIGNPTSATSPLVFTIALGPRGLFPATHLQLAWNYEGTGMVYVPDTVTAEKMVKLEDDIYEITIPPSQIFRAKVNEGETDTGELIAHAWKREKLLGKWSIGKIEGLGLLGYKSTDLARRRVEQWKKTNQENQQES